MPRNRLPTVMKCYSPAGRRNHVRPLKRLLDTWDRNGSTSGPTPWQIYDDDDDYNLATILTELSRLPQTVQSFFKSELISQFFKKTLNFLNLEFPYSIYPYNSSPTVFIVSQLKTVFYLLTNYLFHIHVNIIPKLKLSFPQLLFPSLLRQKYF
jgi:hypothetical protein